jgi:2-oxoglutarate ferredoxin oxidoreductase subunit gamma
MISSTQFAGFGGQGVLLMGYVLSHGAMLKELNVTYFPSYGAEMRGGTANCTVTVADQLIASPVASNPDNLVAMNYPSLEKFEPTVKQAGSERAANMVMIGALAGKAGLLSEEETCLGMEAALKGKEKFFELNRKGISRGYAFGKEGK